MRRAGAVTLERCAADVRGRTDAIRSPSRSRREGMRRGGFEIAARFATGKQQGQAGRRLEAARRARATDSWRGRQGADVRAAQPRRLAGRRHGREHLDDRLDRAAAAAPRPVQFNVAANASNNDDSPLGDYIYLKMVRSTPSRERASYAAGLRATRRNSESQFWTNRTTGTARVRSDSTVKNLRPSRLTPYRAVGPGAMRRIGWSKRRSGDPAENATAVETTTRIERVALLEEQLLAVWSPRRRLTAILGYLPAASTIRERADVDLESSADIRGVGRVSSVGAIAIAPSFAEFCEKLIASPFPPAPSFLHNQMLGFALPAIPPSRTM